MAAPIYTPLPTAPTRTMDPSVFAATADAFAGAQALFQTEGNALGAYTLAQALEALAAATAGNLSDLDFAALKGWLLGFKLDGSGLEGVELIPQAQATETAIGAAEIATQAEAQAGTDDLAMLTSLKGKQSVIAHSPFGNALLHVVDEKSAGVSGGASGAGGTATRALQTVRTNEIAGSGLVWNLAYDAQTANFTVGQIVTGGTSGAVGTIVVDTDVGTTGTLGLIATTGTFADNEAITDPLGGAAVVNAVSGAVTSNTIYLPAGDYWADASAPTYKALLNKAWLYDSTNAVDLVIGTPERSATTYGTTSVSRIDGRFTLIGGAVLEIKHYTENGNADGLGIAVGVKVEIYTDLKIWKLN